MPTPRVISILDPGALLERAVEGLFPLAPATAAQPWPTLSAWLVLRQGGLRDDLHTLGAKRGVAGWFDTPVCLFSELTRVWGPPSDQRPVTECERHAILSRLVDQKGGGIFGRALGAEAWVPAVDRLIGELVSEGITPDAFAAAAHTAANDTFAHDRADALSGIYAEWLETLQSNGRTDGRNGKLVLARAISENPSQFSERLGGRRDVRFVGLADLRGGWRQLIGALAASTALDRLEILTSFPLQLPAELGGECVQPPAAPTFASVLFSSESAATSTVLLVETPDSAREVEFTAVSVRKLIDSGVAPDRIAVVARQARPLVDDIASALNRIGVPVTARRRTELSHTAPARALRAILTAASESWSRHSIAELAENPLLSSGLSPEVVNFVGFSKQLASRAAWRESLAELHARCAAHDRGDQPEDEHRQRLPATSSVASTLAAWNALDSRLAALEASRPLAEWFRWASESLESGVWGISEALAKPIDDLAVWQRDVRAADLIIESALAWAEALANFGAESTPLDAATFSGKLQLIFEQDIVTPPTTGFGVVVSEALAAGWRAFDYLFLVGLSAGSFPQRPASGGLLDRVDRKALCAAGLPLDAPDAWRDRETELFRVICSSARVSLTLSWPAMNSGGSEVARSAFVDEAAATLARLHSLEDSDEALEGASLLERLPTQVPLVPGFPIALSGAAIAHAREVAARENARDCASSPWNGWIQDPELKVWLATAYGEHYVWSATQLEKAAKCQWNWFAERLLHLDPRAEADDEMEATTRGSIAHDALRRFFGDATERMKGPAFLRAADRTWARSLMASSIIDAWNAAAAAGEWLGPPSLQAVARNELAAELQGYLDFEIVWNEKSFRGNTTASKQLRMGAVEGEFAFKNVLLTGAGVPFLLRGSIDRIDRGLDERIHDAPAYIAAIDYKSTIYSTPASGEKAGWDDGVVLQVPLYAAALRKLRPDDLVARMEYRTIRNPAPVHSLVLAPVKKNEILDAPDAEEKLTQALASAARIVVLTRAGTFPTAPTDSCGCSPYCPARDICRIPDGPVEIGW